MRLGQIARKLALRPSEIVDFLSSHNITIEDGINSRLESHHVDLILQKFAPGRSVEEVESVKQDEASVQSTAPFTEDRMPAVQDALNEEQSANVNATSEPLQTPEEGSEVIKAPKIELQGLKVLGKIELPDAKKKEVKEGQAPEPGQPEAKDEKRRSESRKPAPYKKRDQQRLNPMEFAREQERAEAERKRKAEAEQAKEQRTKNYQKRVKTSSPTKRARLIEEQTEEANLVDEKDPPKTWFGRLARWFRT